MLLRSLFLLLFLSLSNTASAFDCLYYFDRGIDVIFQRTSLTVAQKAQKYKRFRQYQELIWMYRREGLNELAEKEERQLIEKIEKGSLKTKVKIRTRNPDSRVFYVKLDNGIEGIYKPYGKHNVEGKLDNPLFEPLAFQFDRRVNLNRISVTVTKIINNVPGSFQAFIKNAENGEDFFASPFWKDRFLEKTGYNGSDGYGGQVPRRVWLLLDKKIRFFDFLFNNIDRNSSNIFLLPEQQAAIDHARILQKDTTGATNHFLENSEDYHPGEDVLIKLASYSDEDETLWLQKGGANEFQIKEYLRRKKLALRLLNRTH